MSTEGVAPSTGLVERLQRYSRYMALVAEQLEALRDDDPERLRRLKDRREWIEAELAEAPAEADTPDDDDGETAPLSHLHDDLCLALAELQERCHTDRWTAEQWSLINEEALKSARAVPTARLAARAYPDLEARPINLGPSILIGWPQVFTSACRYP